MCIGAPFGWQKWGNFPIDDMIPMRNLCPRFATCVFAFCFYDLSLTGCRSSYDPSKNESAALSVVDTSGCEAYSCSSAAAVDWTLDEVRGQPMFL